MVSITGLRGATGEEWYSWSVGATASTLDEIRARLTSDPGKRGKLKAFIDTYDADLRAQGAALGGIWTPASMEGSIAAHYWAGISRSFDDDSLRSARRYERSVNRRSFDGPTIVYTQDLTSVFVDEVEVVVLAQTRVNGEGEEPFILLRAVYFPLWTRQRVLFEALCPSIPLEEAFIPQASAIVSSLTLESSDSANGV